MKSLHWHACRCFLSPPPTTTKTRDPRTPNRFTSFCAAATLACLGSAAQAQVPQYGANVNLDQARKVIAAAVADSRRQNLPMAITVVDTAGQLVAFERMDNTQTASIGVSQDKAVSAAMYRRPTKAFQDVLAAGGVGGCVC